uniref:Uncharacterized protein n=1 Tax=Arundo donax TaxID=35708 RepID=A0A0A9F6M4_ARUDO
MAPSVKESGSRKSSSRWDISSSALSVNPKLQ